MTTEAPGRFLESENVTQLECTGLLGRSRLGFEIFDIQESRVFRQSCSTKNPTWLEIFPRNELERELVVDYGQSICTVLNYASANTTYVTVLVLRHRR